MAKTYNAVVRKTDPQDKAVYKQMQKSPVYFVKVMWKLHPPAVKPEYRTKVNRLIRKGATREFEGKFFGKFKKGANITWQQYAVLLDVEHCLKTANTKYMFTIRSGRGIGKTCLMSWLLIWYLFCHLDAQVSCTANTATQIYDVLWKEAAKWINKLPAAVEKQFEWQTNYIRVHAYENSSRVWWARARTASKENPEAISGMHGDHQAIFVDEASGVPDEIFTYMEGALTDKRPMIFMISNPTRLTGYFYRSHSPQDDNRWRRFAFSAEESPVVSSQFVKDMIATHGKDSDEYRIHVKGEFPREDAVDERFYSRLFAREDFRSTEDTAMTKNIRLGVDPAGEGSNKTAWVLRDDFKAWVVLRESVSTAKQIAQKTLILMDKYGIYPSNVVIDNFGEGANVAQYIALAGYKVKAVNVGDTAKDKERYSNLKAELYFALKEWVRSGGEFVGTLKEWEKEFLSIKFKRTDNGTKIKIKPKKEMVKDGDASPDRMEALMLTFAADKRSKVGGTLGPRKAFIPNYQKISYHRKLV